MNASVRLGRPQSVPFTGLLLTGSPGTDQAGPALHPWGLDLQKNSLQVDLKARVAGMPGPGSLLNMAGMSGYQSCSGEDSQVQRLTLDRQGETGTQPEGRVRK